MKENYNSAIHNPYDILQVSQAASSSEITKAVAKAMKLKRYPLDVIAKAQKSLLDSKKRLIADYLRPILPIIKRFKREDLSLLDQPVPQLIFLPQFDDIDAAIAQSLAEEKLEKETIPKLNLLQAGIDKYNQNNYQEGTQLLEEFIQTCINPQSNEYCQAQMWLAKVYKSSGEIQKATDLCQQLTVCENVQIQSWAKKAIDYIKSQKTKITLSNCLNIFNQGQYLQAIKLLEEFCQNSLDQESQEYLKAQITLIKAYHATKQRKKAVILCQQLAKNKDVKVHSWAKKALKSFLQQQNN